MKSKVILEPNNTYIIDVIVDGDGCYTYEDAQNQVIDGNGFVMTLKRVESRVIHELETYYMNLITGFELEV